MKLFADATAGKGMACRRGVEKVRHLHTSTLWLQKAVYDHKLSVHKVDGDKNVADLGTKVVDGSTMWKLLAAMGFEARTGESKLALRATA